MTQLPTSSPRPSRRADVTYDPEALQALAKDLRARADALPLSRPAIKHQSRGRSWRRIAFETVGALAAVLGIVAVLTTLPAPSTQGALTSPRIYTTTNGQRLNITLGDGTHVTLAPATTLQVTRDEVTLEGEALFNVAKQPSVPFVVRTKDVATTVLGTSFSVRAYATDALTRVAVAEGKVSVKSAVSNAILTNGDFLSATGTTPMAVEHDAEYVANLLRFTQGALVLEVQSLGAAAPQLARWFDLEITVDPAVSEKTLWITLHGESVAESLDMIASITGTRYVRSGKSVKFITR